VLAHELGHVNNRDIRSVPLRPRSPALFTMLASMGRWAMLFGGFGGGGNRDRRDGGGIAALLMLILAPIAASLIQLAVSRSREYQADATGAHFTGNPYALASALQKLDAYSAPLTFASDSVDSASVHHSALLRNEISAVCSRLIPPIAKRIERLTGRPAEFMQ